MNLKNTRLHILREAADLTATAKTGVSLHCHTEHSKEMLDFVPHYAEKLPIIATFWRMERDKYEGNSGKKIDLSTSYWSPPLAPQSVYDIEKDQINSAGLGAIVSITDHDSIDGTLQVNAQAEASRAPISLEETELLCTNFEHARDRPKIDEQIDGARAASRG